MRKKHRKYGEKVIGKVPVLSIGDYQSEEKKIKSFRKYKVLPKGCKTAKRICIKCLTNSISKNDSNYESKICKACTESLPR